MYYIYNAARDPRKLSIDLTVAFALVFFSLQNRELQIMRRLEHCNIVKLKYFFYSSGDKVTILFLSISSSPRPYEILFLRDQIVKISRENEGNRKISVYITGAR